MTRRRDEALEVPSKRASSGLMRCAWETGTARCLLIADGEILGQDKERHGFCLWHEACLRDPRIADDEPAFGGWLKGMAHYCCTWTHYEPEYLWDLVRGRTPPYRLPDACAVQECQFRVFESEPMSPSRLRELIARLSQRFEHPRASREKEGESE